MQQILPLAKIRLVLNTRNRPTHNTIQYQSFLAIPIRRAKSPTNRQFVALLHPGFEPIETALRAGGCKVVAMDAERDILGRMPEHTSRCRTL